MAIPFINPAALKRPVYLSLADQICRAINDGWLEDGARLPPHRTLAHQLALSVQTVSRTYAELIRRGLLSGETGRGTFVRKEETPGPLPYIPERLGEVIDLSILKPVCDGMHLDRMKAALAALANDLPAEAVSSFRPNVIFPRHRAAAADWLRACGLLVQPRNICITNGATAGMTIALMSVATPGTTVVTEAAGHHTLAPLTSYTNGPMP